MVILANTHTMVIIAAVDHSKHAKRVADEAATLADVFDETLHLVHVMSRSEFVDQQTESAEKGEDVADMDSIRAAAAKVADQAGANIDIAHESIGRVGKPNEVINNYADDQDARYIVVGGRKRSPTGKAVFGSVAQAILLNANQPVVSVLKQHEHRD